MDCLLNITNYCSSKLTNAGSLLLLQLFNNLLQSKYAMVPNFPNVGANDYLSTYDFIVIGAGSGGAAVAAGLAAKKDWKILLIEAGDNPTLSSEIPFLFYANVNTTQDYGYHVESQLNSCRAFNNHQCAWPRGKLMGGCSATNAMIYNQGNPRDYDNWEQLGNIGWSWKHVHKYFDLQMNEIIWPNNFERGDRDISIDIGQMFLNAGYEMGYDVLTDKEKVSRGYVGFYKVLGTVENGQRKSSAKAFLLPIQQQTNFHILKNAFVTKLLIDDVTKITNGVEVFLNSKFERIYVNKEVVVSAGSINSPQILMLSGIGPEKQLTNLGINVIQNLPVGQHLQDHPNVMLPITIFDSTSDNYTNLLDDNQIFQYFSQGGGVLSRNGFITNILTYINPKDPYSDIGEISYNYLLFTKNDKAFLERFLAISNFKPNIIGTILEHNKRTPIIFIFNVLLRPKSEGVLTLRSKNPFDHPKINPNTNNVPEDLQTLVYGIRFLQQMFETHALKAHTPKFIDFQLDECKDFVYNSNEYWECMVKQFTATIYHPSGTVRMGTDSHESVVNSRLKVHGIHGLRVADCSIIPKIVGGNLNAPCMMIGSRAADFIKEDWLSDHDN